MLQVRAMDSGSRCQMAQVDVLGVPADGVVDTAADITIMGGEALCFCCPAPKKRLP